MVMLLSMTMMIRSRHYDISRYIYLLAVQVSKVVFCATTSIIHTITVVSNSSAKILRLLCDVCAAYFIRIAV